MVKTPEQKARSKYVMYLNRHGRGVMVDAGPATAYLRQLHYLYGMTSRMMADQCTLSDGYIAQLIAGTASRNSVKTRPQTMLHRENALSVMAIQPVTPEKRGGARVNAVGSCRRVRALARLGYPVTWIGTQCGLHSPTFVLLPQGRRQYVYFSTAYKIKNLYEDLESDPHPERHGIPSQSINLAKYYAARNGYLPPILWDWDTLDDPDGFPDFTGQCGTPAGFRAHRENNIMPVCGPCAAFSRKERK